uniref:Cathepsin n=1 Tax=Lethenteron camtschaticum TaxID=980415 RepID=A0A4Y5JSV7_LETCA|nr:cathepsin [Lethenteron camtschaticum]
MQLLLFATLLTLTQALSVQQLQWDTWKSTYGKHYASEQEDVHRRGVFEHNLKRVLQHNLLADEGNVSFRLGINKYSDLELHEYHEKVVGRFWNLRNETRRTGAPFPLWSMNNLPEQVDWRLKGYVTPVKEQGLCGSSWAFSATGSLEGQHFAATGNLTSLSEQQLVDCTKSYYNNGCNGGRSERALQYIIDNNGIDSELSYPYEHADGKCRFKPANVATKCSSYQFVEPSSNEEVLRQAVASVGPIAIAMNADLDTFKHYKSGLFNEPSCDKSPNHAMLVVGYGTLSGNDFWIVKNSWGEDWGEKGYIYMIRNKDNQCGIASVGIYPII